MQDKKGVEDAEVIRLIGWINNHHNWWEDIAGFVETDPEVLLEMLKSLHKNELHTMFLTVLIIQELEKAIKCTAIILSNEKF